MLSKAERLTDLFAATASKSAFEVREIGSAFRQVAPLAKQRRTFRIEKDTDANLGTVCRSGNLRPEQAGTALRNIIAILSEKPTPAIEDAFKSLGLTFDGVQKQFRESKDIAGVPQDAQNCRARFEQRPGNLWPRGECGRAHPGEPRGCSASVGQ